MKKILLASLSLGLIVTTSMAQNIDPCHANEKMEEYYSNLTPQEKAIYDLQREGYEQEIQNWIQNNPDALQRTNEREINYVIPVVFHILHEGGSENISDEQVKDAVMHMNQDYQKSNNHPTRGWQNVQPEFLDIVADIGIEFKLAKLDPNGNCTNGITRTYTSETSNGDANRVNIVKNQHGNWPGDKYLNIFVAKNIGGAAGYTMYPSSWLGGSMDNGIHVLHNYVGSIGSSTSVGEHTLSHEVGHWLNLAHVWGDSNNPGLQSNCNQDDHVADTPNTMGWTSCTLRGATCGSPVDNVENFMEYSYCSKMFTEGQKARMIAALNNSTGGRNKIWKQNNLEATGVNLPETLCKVDFFTQYTNVCVGQEVSFQDLSYDNVVSWNWEFEGANPSTSTEANPTVSYVDSGNFKVKLTVSDGTNTMSEVKENFMNVMNAGIELPFIEGFENVSTLSNSRWTVVNSGNNATFQVVNDVAHSGSKSIKLANFGQPKDNVDAIISDPIDLSDIDSEEGLSLSFRYAYKKRNASNNESLTIYISNSCGIVWSLRKNLIGNSFSSEVESGSYTPQSQEDWVQVDLNKLNIPSSYWVDNFRVKFEFTSDGGNNLYLDDINIYKGSPDQEPGDLGIDANELQMSDLTIYPNPADKEVNISFVSEKATIATINLVNMMGQTVQMNQVNVSNGENKVVLNTDKLDSGVYLVRMKNQSNSEIVRRLIIQ